MAKLRAVPSVEEQEALLASVLLCMDRAIGHDWPHVMGWTEYAREPQGRGRRPILTTFRICTCQRCGTERRELFVKDGDWLYKVTRGGNRYKYSRAWLEAKRLLKLEQPEIRARLRAAGE